MIDNNFIYFLDVNEEFIGYYMPDDLFIHAVTFPKPIPDWLSHAMYRCNPLFELARSEFLRNHKKIVNEMYQRRHITEKILLSGDFNHSIYENIEFLKEHQEFKPVIDYVRICKSDDFTDLGVWISLDEFIEDIYYNPYLNEKKYVIE